MVPGVGDISAGPACIRRSSALPVLEYDSAQPDADLYPLRRFRRAAAIVLTAVASLWPTAPAQAETIANPVAAFSGLDKITGRITKFDVYIDETVQFGALQITPRVCYTRPPTETQRTSVFIEVDQVSLKGQISRIFTGWMFADSPALNAIDHAVYDIWLEDCKQSTDVPPPEAVDATDDAGTDAVTAEADDRG